MDLHSTFLHITALFSHFSRGASSPFILAFSFIVSTLSFYIGFYMSTLLSKPRTLVLRTYWLLGAALVMGGAITTSHFLGILSSIQLHALSFNVYWLVLAISLAIILPAIALIIFLNKEPSYKFYFLSSAFFSSAIISVYYVSMASINSISIHYESETILISTIIALTFSTGSVLLSVWSYHGSYGKRLVQRWGSALLMGSAVFCMNYISMQGATFSQIMEETSHLSIEAYGLFGIVAATILNIIMLSLLIYSSKSISDIAVKLKADFLHAILKTMKGGVVACDAHGKVTLINPTVTEMFGVKLGGERSIGDPDPSPKGNVLEAIEFLQKPLAQALKGEEVKDFEVLTHDYKGAPRTLLVDGQQIRGYNNENLGAVIVFSDISKRKVDEQELRFRATHDTLTGLPNRTLLQDRLNSAINSALRRNNKVAVIFIDLDNFKLINDALGHTVGDALLKMVATRFTNLMRTTDTLARIGGDEFVVVLPDIDDVNEIPELLNRILHGISKPYHIEQHDINITCSIGFSLYPDHGNDADTLLKNADNAMYQAKDGGKNIFKNYTKSMQTQVRNRFELENGLRKAIQHNQLILEYQPKLDIKRNRLAGIEALVRWMHPKKGLIEPNDFIGIAEDTGLIVPLSRWVLKTACEQNKAWQDEGLPHVTIAVNVSSRQFKDKSFLTTVKETLNETGLEPKYLELELTETLAMANPEEFIKILTQLKKLGVVTSIDDFGTGYSSLNYLRQFPVDSLKIDQSFINEIVEKGGDISIVKAIVSLGHSLNMKVIAEGVETNEQLLQLLQNECDQVQGFYVSRPLSAYHMSEFLRQYIHLSPQEMTTFDDQKRSDL